jgi:hypothetical protein
MEKKDKNRKERRTDGETEEGTGNQSWNYKKQ